MMTEEQMFCLIVDIDYRLSELRKNYLGFLKICVKGRELKNIQDKWMYMKKIINDEITIPAEQLAFDIYESVENPDIILTPSKETA